eukprot:COSAG01_NODE_2727_length_7176_cov_70.215345_3_plen_176_part_00
MTYYCCKDDAFNIRIATYMLYISNAFAFPERHDLVVAKTQGGAHLCEHSKTLLVEPINKSQFHIPRPMHWLPTPLSSLCERPLGMLPNNFEDLFVHEQAKIGWLDEQIRIMFLEMVATASPSVQCAQVGQSAQGAVECACGYLRDVQSGRNAARIALGAGDAGVMDAEESVVPCG